MTQSNFIIYENQNLLKSAINEDFKKQANQAIQLKGNFFVAIPGGSILKILSCLTDLKNDLDWSKIHIFYVNHKCVPRNDPTATDTKARTFFINEVGPTNVYSLVNNETGELLENPRKFYENKLKDLLPIVNNFPQFDLIILGAGKDGHIGSLYPNRKEILEKNEWVLDVDKVIFYFLFIYYFFSNHCFFYLFLISTIIVITLLIFNINNIGC
jgi:6-phosphogluconolactonase